MKLLLLISVLFIVPVLQASHIEKSRTNVPTYSNTYKIQVDNYISAWLDTNPEVVKKYLLANINVPYCCFMYGTILLQERKFEQADVYITKAANIGLPEALNSVGDGYYSGDIRPKNHAKALEYYRWAAKKGYGPAQFNAGIVFLKYAKTAKGIRKAIYWLNKAIDNPEMKELKPYILISRTNAIDKLKNFKK